MQWELWERKKAVKRTYRDGLNRVRKGNETMHFNMLRDAKNVDDNTNCWSIWNKNVNEVSRHVNCSDDFAKQFCSNFVAKNNDEKVNIVKFLAKLTGENDCKMLDMFDVENTEKAVNDMSLSVALDCEKLCIIHLLDAHPAVISCLPRLYKVIVMHEYVPERFGLSVINPIVKNSMKSINDISNYRPISIMLIINKVFEKCIGYVLEPYFVFHDNQFGFVSNGGCGRALFAFKNVVDYFTDRKSKMFCCSLGISKAFDRINHFALLRSMFKKGIPTNINKIFAYW